MSRLPWIEENNLSLVDAVIQSQKDVSNGVLTERKDGKWKSVASRMQVEWVPKGAAKRLNCNGVRRQFAKLLKVYQDKSDGSLSRELSEKMTQYEVLCGVQVWTEPNKNQLRASVQVWTEPNKDQLRASAGKQKGESVKINPGVIPVMGKKEVLHFWSEAERLELIDTVIAYEKQRMTAGRSKVGKWKFVTDNVPFKIARPCPPCEQEFNHMLYFYRRPKMKETLASSRITDRIRAKLDECKIISARFVKVKEEDVVSIQSEAEGFAQSVKVKEEDMVSIQSEAEGFAQSVKVKEEDVVSIQSEAEDFAQSVKVKEDVVSIQSEAEGFAQSVGDEAPSDERSDTPIVAPVDKLDVDTNLEECGDIPFDPSAAAHADSTDLETNLEECRDVPFDPSVAVPTDSPDMDTYSEECGDAKPSDPSAAAPPDNLVMDTKVFQKRQSAANGGQRLTIDTGVLDALFDICDTEKSETKRHFEGPILSSLWDKRGVVMKLKEIISENQNKVRLSEKTCSDKALAVEQISLKVKAMSKVHWERMEEWAEKDNQVLLDFVVKFSDTFLKTSKSQ